MGKRDYNSYESCVKKYIHYVKKIMFSVLLWNKGGVAFVFPKKNLTLLWKKKHRKYTIFCEPNGSNASDNSFIHGRSQTKKFFLLFLAKTKHCLNSRVFFLRENEFCSPHFLLNNTKPNFTPHKTYFFASACFQICPHGIRIVYPTYESWSQEIYDG